MRICFHMLGSSTPVRVSFYYTSPQPMNKKLAKKCCSEKIEKEVMGYLTNLERFEKQAVAAGNREKMNFDRLGRSDQTTR